MFDSSMSGSGRGPTTCRPCDRARALCCSHRSFRARTLWLIQPCRRRFSPRSGDSGGARPGSGSGSRPMSTLMLPSAWKAGRHKRAGQPQGGGSSRSRHPARLLLEGLDRFHSTARWNKTSATKLCCMSFARAGTPGTGARSRARSACTAVRGFTGKGSHWHSAAARRKIAATASPIFARFV